jgi:hypothetical protein
MIGTEVNVTVSSGGRNVVLAGGIVNSGALAGASLEIQAGATSSDTFAFRAVGGTLKLVISAFGASGT